MIDFLIMIMDKIWLRPDLSSTGGVAGALTRPQSIAELLGRAGASTGPATVESRAAVRRGLADRRPGWLREAGHSVGCWGEKSFPAINCTLFPRFWGQRKEESHLWGVRSEWSPGNLVYWKGILVFCFPQDYVALVYIHQAGGFP